MTIRRSLAALLVAASVAIATPLFAGGPTSLTSQERKALRVPEQAAQMATDRVNAARETLERARRDADPNDRAAQRHLLKAARRLAKAEAALAAGHDHAAYVFARRVDVLRLAMPEVQQ